jgi:hypothetical protein
MSEPNDSREPCPGPDCDGVLTVRPGGGTKRGVPAPGLGVPDALPESDVLQTGRCGRCGSVWERDVDGGPWRLRAVGVDPPLDTDVVLHYIDKAHDSFVSNRTHANRVLVVQTVVALITIGVVIGAADIDEFKIGSSGVGEVSDFSIEVWAVLLVGAVFVALTPGFVIGRLLYNVELAKEMQYWYLRVECQINARDATAVPWEIAALVSEAGWATSRGRQRRVEPRDRKKGDRLATVRVWVGAAADFVGGPLTFFVLFVALPVGAQVLAGVWWVKAVDSTRWGWVIGLGVGLLVLLTVASVVAAGLRRQEPAVQDDASSPGEPDEAGPQQAKAGPSRPL